MPTFDVVSKLNRAEVKNAVNQTQRELAQRYDFRGSGSRLEESDSAFTLYADNPERVRSAYGVFVEKLAKRNVSIKHFTPSAAQPAAGSESKLVVSVTEGIERDKAKTIIAHINSSKLKVQTAVQGDAIRISGKKRDDLQSAIAELKSQDFDIELQFINFRD